MADTTWSNKVDVAEVAAQELCENYYMMIRVRSFENSKSVLISAGFLSRPTFG